MEKRRGEGGDGGGGEGRRAASGCEPHVGRARLAHVRGVGQVGTRVEGRSGLMDRRAERPGKSERASRKMSPAWQKKLSIRIPRLESWKRGETLGRSETSCRSHRANRDAAHTTRRARTWARTTTRFWASRKMRTTPPSRRRIARARCGGTRTKTRTTRAPRTNSRRSGRRSTC